MEATMKNIVELFSKDVKREYRIPMYQRNYTWEREDIDQLFYDLERAMKFKGSTKHHFGSVYIKKEQDSNDRREEEFEIIDGQQRMTTVVLVYLALYKKVCEEHEERVRQISDVKEELRVTEIEEIGELKTQKDTLEGYLMIGNKEEGDCRLKITLNTDDDKAIEEIVAGDTRGSLNLKVNYRAVERIIRESDYSVSDYLEALGRLEVMEVILADYDDAQEIFDGLNAKGKPLSLGEQIKNYFLMGKDRKEQKFLYNKYWLPIERGLDYKIGDNFKDLITIYLTIRHKGQLANRVNNYIRIKSHLTDSNIGKEEALKGIKSTLDLRKEIEGLGVTGDPVKDKLSRLGKIAGKEMMVYLIPSYEEYSKGELCGEEYEKVLNFVEGYIVRRSLINKGVGLESIYDWMHREGREGEELGYKYSDTIIRKIKYDVGGNAMYPTDQALKDRGITYTHSIRGRGLNQMVYLFERIENGHGKEFMNVLESYGQGKAYTVEHIMPQTLSTIWEGMLGSNYEYVHKEYLNTLGNLTLTGYNSEYSNRPFKEKQMMVNGYNDSRFTVLNYLPATEEVWTREEIEKRSEKLIDRVIELYPY